jgi:hypothetical protein
MKKEKELLELFCSEQYREWTKHPFQHGDYVYASNGSVAIRIPKSVCEGEYPEEEHSVTFKGEECSHFFRASVLNEMLALCPKTPEYKIVGENIKCPECDGEGVVEWERWGRSDKYRAERWEQEFDCPVCRGTGYEQEAKYVETGREINHRLRGIQFCFSSDGVRGNGKKVFISQLNLSIVLQAMQLLKIERAYISHPDPQRMMHIHLAENIEVYLMELYMGADEEDGTIILDPLIYPV